MTSRIAFFFTEAIRSVMTNLATSVAAVVAMVVALMVFGIFFLVLLLVNETAAEVEQDAAEVRVFLLDSASEDDVNSVREQLEADPRVDHDAIEFIDKKEAYRRATKLFENNPQILEDLPGNPFPASWEAPVEDTTQLADVAKPFDGMPGVKEVSFGGEDAERIIEVARWVQWASFALAAVLLAASTILVSNTIRLSIFARRREIEVMKLVGASNSFVRVPFMIEGFLFGFFGAVGAVALLGSLGWFIDGFLSDMLGVGGPSPETLGTVALAMLGLGIVLGTFGSGVTIRRFLKV